MSSNDRRASARRRAWGRGPMVLRFEPLEGRPLMSAGPGGRMIKPDLVAANFVTDSNLDWGETFKASGDIANIGRAATEAGFRVDVYASNSPRITRNSVLLGSIEIPAGLGPNAMSHFDEEFTLPAGSLNVGAASQTVFVNLRVDAGKAVAETNERNNQDQGPGLDTTSLTVSPHVPANLIGSSLLLTPNSAEWGQDISLTLQVTNNADGNAPASRSRVVLTPSGVLPGGPADVTIASLALPPISAYQLANVTRTIKLPSAPPSALINSTDFTLSVMNDADFVTNRSVSSRVAQGLGLDQATISITKGVNPAVEAGLLPELAASGLSVPTTPVAWGESIQVATTVQNIGRADVGSEVRVRFFLAGASGSMNDAIFLADTSIAGLKTGESREVQETVTIPARLPSGVVITGNGTGRILVVVDPENAIDEPLRTNNIATSAPIQLRLITTNGNVKAADVATGNLSQDIRKRQQLQLLKAQAAQNTKSGFEKFTNKVGNEIENFFDKIGIFGNSR